MAKNIMEIADVSAAAAKVNELKRLLMELRFAFFQSSGQKVNTSLFKKVRRDIARIKTAFKL